MVKITGEGRGMRAMAAHFWYIGRQGTEEVGGKGKMVDIEDRRGEKIQGRDGLVQLADEWRVANASFADNLPRRKAFNIVFSIAFALTRSKTPRRFGSLCKSFDTWSRSCRANRGGAAGCPIRQAARG